MATALKIQPLLLTYEDYRHAPEDGRRYELLQGSIVVSPAPLTSHQRISRNLEVILEAHITDRSLGELFDAPVDVLLERHTVVQPDLVYVARAHLAIVTERGIEGPPDLVVEILSSSTQDRDRGVKLELYALHGVLHYWIVDLKAQCIEERVLEATGSYSLRQTHRHPHAMRSALFAELSIDLQRVFRPMLSPG